MLNLESVQHTHQHLLNVKDSNRNSVFNLCTKTRIPSLCQSIPGNSLVPKYPDFVPYHIFCTLFKDSLREVCTNSLLYSTYKKKRNKRNSNGQPVFDTNCYKPKRCYLTSISGVAGEVNGNLKVNQNVGKNSSFKSPGGKNQRCYTVDLRSVIKLCS